MSKVPKKVDSSIIEDIKKEYARFVDLLKIKDPSKFEKEDLEVVGDNIERLLKRALSLLDLDEFCPFVSVAPKFTLETLRGIIDSLGLSSRIRDENIVIILPSDDDFPFDVVMCYGIEGEWMKCVAYPVGCDITQQNRNEALNIINDYNRGTRMFKSYIDDDGTVWLERQEFIESCLRNYDIKNIIGSELTLAWRFFEDNKEFFLANKNK